MARQFHTPFVSRYRYEFQIQISVEESACQLYKFFDPYGQDSIVPRLTAKFWPNCAKSEKKKFGTKMKLENSN